MTYLETHDIMLKICGYIWAKYMIR